MPSSRAFWKRPVGLVHGDRSGIIDPPARMRITADPGRRITVSGVPVGEYGEGAESTYVLPGVHSVSADGGPATWVLCGGACQVYLS